MYPLASPYAHRYLRPMRVLPVLLLPLLLAAASPGAVRVRIETSAGPITIAVNTVKAPKTAANFLAYVDDERLVGTTIYRASRRKSDPRFGFIQGGIDTDHRRALPPVKLEPTNVTGLSHVDGAVSMAHGANPDSATGNFTIMVGANPALDARGSYRGYAAFGRVVAGMETVKKILAMPTGGGRDAMKGQMILKPVKIVRTVRLDGRAKPTGRVKPWLIFAPR
jgi:peptidyl-prolyl cis-trans isomerase A (cyclophilin A)